MIGKPCFLGRRTDADAPHAGRDSDELLEVEDRIVADSNLEALRRG